MQLAIFQMYRKPDEMSDSIHKAYKTSPAQFFPTSTKYQNSLFKSQMPSDSKSISLPFNQVSAINLGQRVTPKSGLVNEKPQTNSSVKIFPNTKKVYFTFIRPQDLQVQRRYIQTIVHHRQIPFASEWEQRYYQLEKNMSLFIQNHERMSQQFMKIKEQMRSSSKFNKQASEIGLLKTKQMLEERYQQQVRRLRIQIERLRDEGRAEELQIRNMLQKNIRMQNYLQKNENNLMSERNEKIRIEKQRNDLRLQVQIQEQNQKIWDRQKKVLQNQIYDLKMVLANKNIEIQKLEKKGEQKIKSFQGWAKQNLEENLNKKKEEYNRKQKKYEKTITLQQQQIDNLKLQLTRAAEKGERKAQECKKLQGQLQESLKKFENLQQMYQSLMQVKGNQPILSYEAKIKDLNKMLGQKNQNIKQAKEQIKKLNQMIDQYADNYISQKQLDTLKSDIEEKKNRILEQGGVNYDQLNNKATFYFNDKIFQSKMIYQLKKDNQKMLTILQKIDMGSIARNHLHVTHNTLPFSDQSPVDFSLALRKIIYEIVEKTQRISMNIKSEQPNSEALIRSMKSIRDDKSKNSRKSEKKKRSKVDSDKENPALYSVLDQIQILKIYLVDLSSTWQKFFQKLEEEKKQIKKLTKKQSNAIENERILQNMCPKNEQLIQYYKVKNEELENRVNQLLSFGDLLKNRLVAKNSTEDCASTSDYWKNEAQSTQDKCTQIQSRYDKLLEEYDRCIQRIENYESKIALLSLEIDRLRKQKMEQEEKIKYQSELSAKNENILSEKSKLQRQLSISSSQVEKIATKLQESFKQLSSKQRENYQLDSKVQQLLKQKQHLQIRLNEKIKQQSNTEGELRLERKRIEGFQRDLKMLQEECTRKNEMVMETKKLLARMEREMIQIQAKNQERKISFQIEQNKICELTEKLNEMKVREEKLIFERRSLEETISQLRMEFQSSSKQKGCFVQVSRDFYYLLEKMRSCIQQTENLVECANQQTIRAGMREKIKENFNQILKIVSQLSQSGIKESNQTQEDINSRSYAYLSEYLRALLLELEQFVKEMDIGTERNGRIKLCISQQINKGLVQIALLSDFHI